MRKSDKSIDGEILAQQVHAIVRLTVPMMLACISNAVASLYVLYISDQLTLIAIVWGGVSVIIAVMGLIGWYKKRNKTFPKSVTSATRNKAVRSAALLGFVWAFPGIAILPYVTGAAEAFFIALAALYPLPRAAFTYCSLVAGINLFGFFQKGQAEFAGFAIVTAMFLMVVLSGILRHREIFVSEFRNRLLLAEKTQEVQELLEQSRSDAIEQKIKSERRLLQAQKMEAVGQLTGGIDMISTTC